MTDVYEEWRTYPPVPEKIDVVLPWLNPTDKWKKDYAEFCADEDPCRIRDLNTIRPTINGIIKNMPFVRYIWLIVYDEEQLTGYEDFLSLPKIKIVYHKDIIPEEFLPNFNSLLPAMFCYKIKDLAENFIFMNDDMIVTKTLSSDMYFSDKKPIHQKTKCRIFGAAERNPKVMWAHVINSTHAMLKKITGGKDYGINNFHMPIPLRKSMYEFLFDKYGEIFYDSCRNSKIRQPHNISMPELVFWVDEAFDLCEYKNIYSDIKTRFIVLSDNTTRKDIEDALQTSYIVCINDSENLKKNAESIASIIKDVFNS